jgi:hypothetical protein
LRSLFLLKKVTVVQSRKGHAKVKAEVILTMIKRAVVIMFVAIGIFVWVAQAKSNDQIAYPTGYRNWVHIKSTLIGPESPNKRYTGFHHIYANEKALEGYRSGQFADGSVIVFDVLEAQVNAATTAEGARRFIDMMVKDSQRFADTGGWGFEEFEGDSQTQRMLTAQAKAACYTCHTQRKEKGFVFSIFRK